MARLRRAEGADDEGFGEAGARNNRAKIKDSNDVSIRRLRSCSSSSESGSDAESIVGKLVMKAPKIQPRKDARIKLAPLSSVQQSPQLFVKTVEEDKLERSLARASRPIARWNQGSVTNIKKGQKSQSIVDEVLSRSDEDDESHEEESIWCGSESNSEDEQEAVPLSRNLQDLSGKQQLGKKHPNQAFDLAKHMQTLSIGKASDRPPNTKGDIPKNTLGRDSSQDVSSDKRNSDAVIRFSPKQSRSPAKLGLDERPTTPPPASPSKSRLQSPSKKNVRLPTPPGRPSLDNFWNAQSVNEWNDKHSPQKPLASPRKQKASPDESSGSPTAPQQSPQKRTKAELAARKLFNTTKHDTAALFLAELDAKITNGEIQALASSTGGVQVVWSKTLNSTAGRANWRRETTKTRNPSSGEVHVTHRHFASIELAEKVIDDEHRLLNVLAHEFCHLANFMVSGVKDQPHGRQFKEWGRRCSRAFADRGVTVTTKHTYEIEYRYIWRCEAEACAREYKRHSKSIDPRRHACGICRAKLVQIKPVPRKQHTQHQQQSEGDDASKGGGTRTGQTAAAPVGGGLKGYAAFVKLHFAAVKQGLPPGTSHKHVMEALGAKYRAERDGKTIGATRNTLGDRRVSLRPPSRGTPSSIVGQDEKDVELRDIRHRPDVEDVAKALDVIVLSDDET